MLKIWDCSAAEGSYANAACGEVIESKINLLVKTGDGCLVITELQGQNGKRMKAGDFLRGRVINPGTVLGY